jgi:hypothetical protein
MTMEIQKDSLICSYTEKFRDFARFDLFLTYLPRLGTYIRQQKLFL